MTVYVMGDMHGDFDPIFTVLSYMDFKKEDILCLLGDSGFNYDVKLSEKGYIDRYIDTRKSLHIKHSLNDGLYRCLGFLPTLLIVHGNHEARANTVAEYEKKIWNEGIVYVQMEYSNLLFAKDGEIYTIDDHTFLVCGGAYSLKNNEFVGFVMNNLIRKYNNKY